MGPARARRSPAVKRGHALIGRSEQALRSAATQPPHSVARQQHVEKSTCCLMSTRLHIPDGNRRQGADLRP
eukprot:7114148-Alexandrium_andersonii.AAC.1